MKSIVEDENAWKTVLRETEILNVLKKNHEEPDAGHLGREHTYERIKVLHYWPGMYQDVSNFVGSCDICKTDKYKQTASQANIQTRQPISSWAVVAADVMGPFPRSKNGAQYVLVIQDLYTRFIEVYTLRRHTGDASLS